TRSKRDWSSDVCSSDLKPLHLFLGHTQSYLRSLRHILPNFLSAGLHFLEYSFLTLQLLLTFLQVKYNQIQHLAPMHQSNKLHLRSEERRVGKEGLSDMR